jgi:hypothetical protein
VRSSGFWGQRFVVGAAAVMAGILLASLLLTGWLLGRQSARA